MATMEKLAELLSGRPDIAGELSSSPAAPDLGCVKTLEAVADRQQKNQARGLGESFVRERRSV
jgi:hypothetical protein